MNATTLRLDADTVLHTLAERGRIHGGSTHAVVHRDRCIWIDCHAAPLASLPVPELILHTHVQPEHCAEGARFPQARIAGPRRWPYPALLPWYGLGQDGVPVDAAIPEGGAWRWDGLDIACLHLPGHCHAHAGYLLDRAGERVALTAVLARV